MVQFFKMYESWKLHYENFKYENLSISKYYFIWY